MKHSSDYTGTDDSAALQAAFDDLQAGDTLFINKDYRLISTVTLAKDDVQIIGLGGLIRPNSNGNPSPLIRIGNIATTKTSINNVYVSGLRFDNDKAISPNGLGIAIEVRDDTGISGGSVYHIKLANLDIGNFQRGILVKSAFDVVIENCQVAECRDGLRIETTSIALGENAGQIKVFGGFFNKNEYHLVVDNSVNADNNGDISLYGWTPED